MNAPIAATWDAVIDVFADRNIPVRTMERASGFIATHELTVGADESGDWAVCTKYAFGYHHATRATFNVLVRGDDRSSTVKVTALWADAKMQKGCTTTHVWESSAR